MLRPKHLKFFVGGLLAITASGIAYTLVRNAAHHERLTNLTNQQIIALRFYQDGLREPRDLDLPVTDRQDIGRFLAALHTLRPSAWQIKTLGAKKKISMRMEITSDSNRLYTINIYRSDKTGELGIVSISDEGVIFSASAGVYESPQLLQWAESMEKHFKNISVEY